MKPIDVVKSYYAAIDAHDMAKARALMRDDFRFDGPMMQASSPEEMFSQMKAMGFEYKSHVLHMAENGSTVAALFDCAISSPFKATIRMSEWLTVKDGKIASSNLIYDTKKMPAPKA